MVSGRANSDDHVIGGQITEIRRNGNLTFELNFHLVCQIPSYVEKVLVQVDGGIGALKPQQLLISIDQETFWFLCDLFKTELWESVCPVEQRPKVRDFQSSSIIYN